MPFCRKCGKELKENAKFCATCGNPVVSPLSDRRDRMREQRKPMNILYIVSIVIIALAGAAIILSSIWPIILSRTTGPVIGSGILVTDQMDFSGFTTVEVGSGFEVEITASNSYSVSITADDNVFDYIEASKSGDALRLRLNWFNTYQSITLRAEITMPALHELRLSSGAHGTVKAFNTSHKFILDLSGGSSLDMSDALVGDIEIDLSGGSNIELDGAANDLLVSASSGSNLDLSAFLVHNAKINLREGSRATINLDGRLDADLRGGSQLRYIGEPTLGDIQTSGGSTIVKD